MGVIHAIALVALLALSAFLWTDGYCELLRWIRDQAAQRRGRT